MLRGRPKRCGACLVCVDPKRQRKEKCLANVVAPSADELSSPPPAAKRESKPRVLSEPAETLRDQRQPDGKRRPDPQPSPSPSPQQPRPMTSLTSLQLWLNQPKIDQRVQELERQIGQIALGEPGQVNPELHEFLITLVTGRRALRTASK